MDLGSKIKQMRNKKGLTQEELADRCELTKGYISQLENNLNSPSIATLTDILSALGSNLSEFFQEEREETSRPQTALHQVADRCYQRLRSMIRATFDRDFSGFTLSGHAGYAEAGEDIVCAAVSALAQSTLNGLQSVIRVPVMYDIDDQAALLEARLTPEADEAQVAQAQILLKTLLEGLQAIERSYPRNVRIFFEERR